MRTRYHHPIRVTALLYLKEAVAKQRFEDCAMISRIAREHGARNREISCILSQALASM